MNHHGGRKDALNVNTKIGNWDEKKYPVFLFWHLRRLEKSFPFPHFQLTVLPIWF